MYPKTQTYIDLAQSAARQITSNYRSWTGFLRTASRLYKYSYADQLLIHAQRPEATACAEYDLWNNVMHRYVRRGAKGIALLDVRAGQVGCGMYSISLIPAPASSPERPLSGRWMSTTAWPFPPCWSMNTQRPPTMGCPISWTKSPGYRRSPTGRITTTMRSVSLTIRFSPGMMNMRSKRPSAGR